MFFKRTTATTIYFSLICLFGTGCNNDYNFIEPETIVSLAYNTNCLDELKSDFELYKKEILSEDKLSKDFECLRDALDYIKLRVKGEEAHKFTSSEIERFLNKIFFDEPKSASFYTNVLIVKSQIWGGDASHLTFEDFDNLKTFLTSAEETAKYLQPYASELFFESPFEDSELAESAVRSLMPFVNKWIKFTKKNIEIKPIFDLLQDAEVEVKSKENWIRLFNLVRESSSDQSSVLNQDKEKLVGAVQKYFQTVLNLYRTLDREWEHNREDFFDLSNEIKSGLRAIEGTIKGHPDQKWSRSDLIMLMNLVSDFEVVGQELSVPVREHIIDVVFGKWFVASEKSVELVSENFKKIENSWSDIDAFIVDSKKLEGFVGKTFPFVKEGTNSFALFTQQRWPSLVRKDRTLFIPDYEPEVTFSFQSLFHVAWQFTAAKILVEAYTEDEVRLRTRTGISIEEVKEAYLDVFVFLKEIEFLGEESRGGWFRIFNEGNLFVPSANPDGYVSVSETADYAAFLFSAIFMGRNISDSIEAVCPNFVETCSFSYIRQKPDIVFEALPGLVDYFSNGLEKSSYKRWQTGFEYIAKLDNNDKNYESSHWFRGTVANQYNEVIYRKYDLDKSDTLSFEEVSAAYGDFKSALKLLPQVKGTDNEDKDEVLKSFLTLFVKDGRLPQLANGRPRGKLIRHVIVCGGVQTSTNRVCTFESDRSKIMALLAFLTSI